MSTKRRPARQDAGVVRFVSARERFLDSILQQAGTNFAEVVVQGNRDLRQWARDKELRQEALDARRSWDNLARRMGSGR